MSNGLKNLLIFLGGAGTGAAGMYLFLKHFSKKPEDEEAEYFYVDSIDTEHAAKVLEQHENLNKPEIGLYVKEIKENGFIDYTKFSEKEKIEEKGSSDEDLKEKVVEEKEIRVIDEQYFDGLSDEDYRFVGYSYFNDGVLADENNEKIEEDEIETSVGTEWESYFKDPECDAVYVVNERLHVAYEILRDLRIYKDVAEARGE